MVYQDYHLNLYYKPFTIRNKYVSMKSCMCKLRVGSFITQYSLLPLCNVCGNKKVLFGNFNLETETFNLYMWNGECFTDVIFSYFLRATRGARNPNLQVVITHASHLCSQHSFGLPLRMNGCIERNLITRVWTFYHS